MLLNVAYTEQDAKDISLNRKERK